jgi:hypothetical protein
MREDSNSVVIRCPAPALDPTLRSLLPIGLVGLVGFVLFWLGTTLGTAVDAARVLLGAERLQAELVIASPDTPGERVRDGFTAVLVGADRAAQSIAPPKGVAAVAGTRFDVVRSGTGVVPREAARNNLIGGIVMALFGVLMGAVGLRAWRELRADQRRIAALRRSDLRIQPLSVRVEREQPKRKRKRVSRPPWFRLWAEFEHGGRRYEAPGELQPTDPGLPDPESLRVSVLRADPRQSMLLDGGGAGTRSGVRLDSGARSPPTR